VSKHANVAPQHNAARVGSPGEVLKRRLVVATPQNEMCEKCNVRSRLLVDVLRALPRKEMCVLQPLVDFSGGSPAFDLIFGRVTSFWFAFRVTGIRFDACAGFDACNRILILFWGVLAAIWCVSHYLVWFLGWSLTFGAAAHTPSTAAHTRWRAAWLVRPATSAALARTGGAVGSSVGRLPEIRVLDGQVLS